MAALKGAQVPVASIPSHPLSPPLSNLKKPKLCSAFLMTISNKVWVSRSMGKSNGSHIVRFSNPECRENSIEEEQRPPFDLNLAVLLAGFAFEAYSSPPKDVGWREVDAAECQTVFLSQQFLREVYDGRLFIKLRKGVDFPAMDPWGTSDPYVIIQLDGQVAKSSVKWATKEPIWNEEFTLNTKISATRSLQVAAWDANLVTPHKRMGNAEIKLESFCDGNLHEVMVELEGIGGGGKIYLEVKYKSYDEIDEEAQWWRLPFVSGFLMKTPLGSALKMALGSQSVNASQFVQAAFGQLTSFNNTYLQKLPSSNGNSDEIETSGESYNSVASSKQSVQQEMSPEGSMANLFPEKENKLPFVPTNADEISSSLERKIDESEPPDKFFWTNFSDILNQSVLKKLGFSLPEIKRWDGIDFLNQMSMQSQRIAEEDYVESGLATPERKDDDGKSDLEYSVNGTVSSTMDIKKASWNVLSQTETILGALMVLASTLSQQKNDSPSMFQVENKKNTSATEAEDVAGYSMNNERNMTVGLTLDTTKEEEMRKLFSSAESAMEAWAMLATSLGRTSFIKSEFEKICFLDNVSTDTQVAIWRDSLRRRLVVAFRGTEQVKWKDLRTDLMLVPAGLNPERLGGDFKQELQVHSGFLNAYDSVRNRIMTLVKLSIGASVEDALDSMPKWHVYVTGHSLGGALATLLALELSSSRMAKSGAISVTMYNFGSPRVGNRRFSEVYNEKVKDSWRVVNHRDIIPTVPRLMGYCHVAQPVYLAAGDLREALVNLEILGDGYQGDVLGESTPDVLVSEFMKGEKQLVEKILQTEINLLRSIRDGTALMQHMEDFYYISLLERVRSKYKRIGSSRPSEEDFSSAA